MSHSDIHRLIEAICADTSTDFKKRTKILVEALDALKPSEIIEHVEYGGVIPEFYPHDSSEEKLFAKYCDVLLARALTLLGLTATVLEERGDAADVRAICADYSIVGDAKAFRLSRTAKNQKDFKVESLHKWKYGSTYACLVCPLYQYPVAASQIYEQAARCNVTLLSYIHLAFLLRSGLTDAAALASLWSVAEGLASGKDAIPYWNAVSREVARVCGRPLTEWENYLDASKKFTLEQAREQKLFWDGEKIRIANLSHADAVRDLIRALRIDNNISLISRTIADLEKITGAID